MLENNELFNNLLAWYGKLLTDKQLQIMQHYYQDDLSLAEIAANNNVSRAAIHDTIKRSEELLLNYEAKLKVFHKFTQRDIQYQKLKQLDIDDVNDIVKTLEEIE